MDAELIGSGLLVRDDGRVLLLRRIREPWKGLWELPGGHVKEGETLEDAVVREIKEETNLEVRLRVRKAGGVRVFQKPIEVFLYPVLDHYHLNHVFRFRVKSDMNASRPKATGREGTLKWCDKSQKNLNPLASYVFNRYIL